MARSSILVAYSLMFCFGAHGHGHGHGFFDRSKRSNITIGFNVLLQNDSECQAGLIGVSSGSKGAIPNSAMSASSSHRNYPAHSGRLLSNKWWMPAVHDKSQYLKVDLTHLALVQKSAVQGSGDSTTAGARVISYFLYHSIDEDIWFTVLEKENARMFVGNINNSEVTSNSSFGPFLARYVKFCPQRWTKEIALRVELYGCKAEGLNSPIGMELKSIRDDSITATSVEGNTFHPSSARLHLNIAGGGWCANKSLHDVPQYLQVDLDRSWALIAVATQGIQNLQNWVTEYYVSTTFDHKVWIFVHDFTGKKLFKGNSNPPENAVMHHFPSFTWANGVRIHPHNWYQSICLRVEFYGMDSTESFTIPNGFPCDDNAELRGPNSMQYIRTCFCSTGYEGDTFYHCEDVDECSIGDNVCDSPERQCINTPGSFNCDCTPGTTKKGDNCEDIDECTNARDVCPFLTVCVNTVGSFICDCREPGYLADGKQCLDIDECKIGNHTCKEDSVCVNALGSFACFCKEGYTGWISMDGKQQCSDIDECAINSKLCDSNGECVNTVGSYYCLCKTGFVARGSECEDLDECASSSAVCEHDALCINLPGSYACQCKLGYLLTDSLCQDVNECQQNLAECHPRADCYNTDGSYLCVCKTGLYGDGFFCSKTEHCSKEDEGCNAALKREEQSGVNVEVFKSNE